MLFEELVLHNFGIYKGRHIVNLSTEVKNKPVILFGALNGGGKTTFLDAIKLALYGKFAACSNRGSLSYKDFLRRAINRHVDVGEGAGVEIQFRHRHDGVENSIRVIRTWHSIGKGLKETTEVLRNGVLDPVITERWYEYVDEFMPVQISNLFFFDGEKIEGLASPEASSELIRTGLHALLGLDLVDKLSRDLKAVATKRKTKLTTSKDQILLNEQRLHIEALKERQSEKNHKLASERTKLQIAQNKTMKLRDEFRREGGDLLEQRDAIEAEEKATKERLNDAENNLRELASGAAPLLLVRNLLNEAHMQSLRERDTRLYAQTRTILIDRDKTVIDTLTRAKADNLLIKLVLSSLTSDIEARDKTNVTDCHLIVDPDAFSSVSNIVLDDLLDQIKLTLEHNEVITEDLSGILKKLAGVPDPTALSGISCALESQNDEARRIEIQIAIIESEIDELSRQLESKEANYERTLEEATDKIFMDETNLRVITHSEKLRDTLTSFRQQVALKHIRLLESLILESFYQLIRKPDLVSRIEISPDTYQLTLLDKKGEILPSECLSAGERQLLAVSILWGLAKASDRPLPMVIDTPLGRLDSTHRKHLIKNYFPHASHQVLLLSTDEEIDEGYYADLKSSINLEYQINYDSDISTSTIDSGYFWSS